MVRPRGRPRKDSENVGTHRLQIRLDDAENRVLDLLNKNFGGRSARAETARMCLRFMAETILKQHGHKLPTYPIHMGQIADKLEACFNSEGLKDDKFDKTK